ncbi:enoyl-CoA hydratase [Exophiala viscosa]|uniref:Enoyl-CoA hydratase n=2 Tax=Exophiala viscosa TaxID=2486360 RepID=A0AAN6I9G7_9EURO|nr:enoyl-CoA hydratase [Exophiala viscosa]
MATTGKYKYTDIILEIKAKIGIIRLNRPKSLNAFGGKLLIEVVSALRELNEHPDTVFTVLTGEGRFFSSGADVKAAVAAADVEYATPAEKKVAFMATHATTVELLRSIIDHKKVFVLALNGPAVGGGAAWFEGVADIILAADDAYLQVPFSALGLVPEFGSATSFYHSIGAHRANDFLMFGRKLTAQELEQWGLVNRIFPKQNFQQKVLDFLEEQLDINDGKSMMEAKRLQNLPLRRDRMLAVYDAAEALAERIVEDAQKKRFQERNRSLNSKGKGTAKL